MCTLNLNPLSCQGNIQLADRPSTVFFYNSVNRNITAIKLHVKKKSKAKLAYPLYYPCSSHCHMLLLVKLAKEEQLNKLLLQPMKTAIHHNSNLCNN